MINMVNITRPEAFLLLRILNVSYTASHEYEDFPTGMENLIRKLMKTAHDYKPFNTRSGSYSPLAELMIKISNETTSNPISKRK